MIIKEIHIDGFGLFNGFSLTGLDNGVNILMGNNEVGKSTLLAFLRHTLFGYPDKRSKVSRYEPLNGGSHGGRIKAVLHSGKEAIFERYAGSKGGSIHLHYNGQETQNPGQWYQLLGNASAELYKNVYAFSLDELVDLGSLSESGVEDKIFSVGLGMGNISIGEVESNIHKQTENIYTPRGKNQSIPQILKKIDGKKKRVQQIQQNMPQYQDLTGKTKDLEKEVNELDDQLKSWRNEANQLNNYLKCYPYFITTNKADQALKVLPAPQDYPEKGIEKLTELEEKEKTLSGKIRDLKNGTEEEKGIGELENTAGQITYNAELLEKKDTVEYLRKNLEKYKQTLSDKKDEEQEIRNDNQAISQGIASISGNWAEEDISGFTGMAVHTNAIEGYKKIFENITNEKRDLEAQLKASEVRKSSLNARAVVTFMSIIFFIGSVPGFYYGWYILGVALLLIALLLLLGRNLLFSEEPDSELKKKLKEMEERDQQSQQEYQRYLEQQLMLTGSLSPEAALAIFRQIDQLKEQIRERDNLKEKIRQQREPFIRQFESAVSELQDLSAKTRQEKNTEIIVNQLVYEYDHAREQAEKTKNIQKELDRKKTALKNAESDMQEVRKEIDRLLTSIQAADRQDFRRKYEQNNQVEKYIHQKNEAIQAIENIAGSGNAGEVIDYLRDHDKELIEQKVRELNQEIEEKHQEWQKKTSELGEKRNELKRIEGESELAEVMTELETERQRLQEAYKEWMTGKMALEILGEVKSKYEQEKQPEVIKNSSRYFNKITRGRYSKVRVALDDKEVAVYDSREASKKIHQLSRGTKEQLLMSLRLGFIEEYEKQAEPLPLIMDEVLVNFDAIRAGETAKILQEFGKNRQILMFTCHPTTHEHFESDQVQFRELKSAGQTEEATN